MVGFLHTTQEERNEKGIRGAQESLRRAGNGGADHRLGHAAQKKFTEIVEQSYKYAAAMMEESERTQPPKGKWNMRMTSLGPD